ncbi:hypothetical protein GUITHDRAFT_162467 [Guillardia theta CCMP2712]|uniref:PDZ domain-containing protein n=1 Tax=Guillardia theta (strain CCMP2712) TaxID=905079 RepID=L1JIL1_GUITC|nr:hypothetical protein GUITHDRAFT_162467 [Guillardia theta CCMP2712]EKX48353.1 hypothetical protein GUITHDRAFT_162467 [Guillardia theta CCMP2712]|eukprot:XP_005835333.1 hypothetical protein GUITHDRAFT_162467 [Guillardia theta CCMP2712]
MSGALDKKVALLEKTLLEERNRHLQQLREIASAAGLREAQAVSILASCRRSGVPSSIVAHIGPGTSPTDSEGSSSTAPPQGAQDPPRSKLDRWITRTKVSPGTGLSPDCFSLSPESLHSENKLDRWLARLRRDRCPEENRSRSKLDRWIGRTQQRDHEAVGTACPSESWERELVSMSEAAHDKEVEIFKRIQESWKSMDKVLAVFDDQNKESDEENSGSEKQDNAKAVYCTRCGGNIPDSPTSLQKESSNDWNNSAGRDGREGTQMGLRMEEKSRGLTVTHVVPGGQAGQAGLEVKDVIRQVNGRKVSSLKAFGSVVRDSPCDVVCLDLIRGSGSSHKHLTLYSRIRPHDESATEDEKKISQESLKEIYCSTQGSEKVDRENKNKKIFLAPSNTQAKYNKYGKDTKLWIPESDESSPDVLAASSSSTRTEIGGFFMFPPGHPDYVPLPPGEAALIAGREHVHPSERLAPHWSHVTFTSPTGVEIRAQARHATYGTIEHISGPLVHADPITAHQELSNADQIRNTVAYIKRGGAPFTKKARVAVAAGAVACVVANHDRETFGMSYTDDGMPFDALNIPCVMISSDVASKLEAFDSWTVVLEPAKPEQQGSKRPPPAPAATTASATKGESSSSPSGPSTGGGRNLETLPADIVGAKLGHPGKKPTMWKKIKLLLP